MWIEYPKLLNYLEPSRSAKKLVSWIMSLLFQYMKIPSQAIEELQELYLKKFGIKLSKNEVEKEARDLLTFTALGKGHNFPIQL